MADAPCVVPEVRQLIKQWDTLSWDVKVERSGDILIECGGDILVPGAALKLAKKGVKGTQKLARAAKGLKTAKQTLLLEVAAEIGSSARVGEIVTSGRNTLFLDLPQKKWEG